METFRCDVCGEGLDSRRKANKHFDKVHGGVGTISLSSSPVVKRLSHLQKQDIGPQLRLSMNPNLIVEVSSTEPLKLEKDVTITLNNRRHKCKLCGKEFNYRVWYTRHCQHPCSKKSVQLKCDRCSGNFSSQGNLRRHQIGNCPFRRQNSEYESKPNTRPLSHMNSNPTENVANKVEEKFTDIDIGQVKVEHRIPDTVPDNDDNTASFNYLEEYENVRSPQPDTTTQIDIKPSLNAYAQFEESTLITEKGEIGMESNSEIMECDICHVKVFDLSTHLYTVHFDPQGNGMESEENASISHSTNAAKNQDVRRKLTIRHSCSICGKTFCSRTNYLRHHRVFHSRVIFNCCICSKMFTRKTALKQHQLMTSCGKEFAKLNTVTNVKSELSKMDSVLLQNVDADQTMGGLRLPENEELKQSSIPAAMIKTTMRSKPSEPRQNSIPVKSQGSASAKAPFTPSPSQSELKKPRCNFNPITGLLTCNLCLFEFSNKKSFDNHYETVHLKIRFECQICHLKFNECHLRYHHHRNFHMGLASTNLEERKNRHCHLCKRDYVNHLALIRHIRIVHLGVRENECDICGKLFSDKGTMNRHKSQVHMGLKRIKNKKLSRAVQSIASCDIRHQGRKITDRSGNQLQSQFTRGKVSHIESSMVPSKEPSSNLESTSRKSGHVSRIATSTSKYAPQEDQSEALMATTSSLKEPGFFILHRDVPPVVPNNVLTSKPKCEINSETGKFKCICGKEFRNLWNCYNHYESVHLGTRFKCQSCDKVFTLKSTLKVHNQSVHFGQRIKCKYCSKTYASRSSRATHMLKVCKARSTSLV